MGYRDETKVVQIGKRQIGGGNPILIQSMCNTKTEDVEATVEQILALEHAGCDIIRVAVPTMEAAAALTEIKRQIHIPLVADIHFDYRLAIAAIECGADKIRINPGNIGSRERIQAVVDKAKEYGVPIRVGVNSGSLEKPLVEKYGGVTAEGLVESALDKVALIEQMGYDNLVISIKSSDVMMCVKAHELIAKKTHYPLHVGITEAGTVIAGNIKSAVGLGLILSQGIGDTIRVSRDRQPAGGDQVGKADFEDAGTSSGWRGSCFMSDLRTHADRPHRSGKPGGDAGTGISAGYQGCRHGLRGQRTGRGEGSRSRCSRRYRRRTSDTQGRDCEKICRRVNFYRRSKRSLTGWWKRKNAKE